MKPPARILVAVSLCTTLLATTACTWSLLQIPSVAPLPTQPALPAIPTATALPRAQTVFLATLDKPLASGERLALALLDEVTGLALNPQLFPMSSTDGLTYTATLALPYKAVVKYRYVRLGASQVQETSAGGGQIRYRLYSVTGPAEVRDLIASWPDTNASRPTGNIQGRVLNADTGTPVPNILVTAGGRRAFTDSAGRFDLQDLVPGTHNLVAYALDGTYQTFQQGATVAEGLNTAVDIKIRAAPLVRVTFYVNAPNDIQGAPVRIAGNLIELGNTFADLKGGLSTVAERMPVMLLQPDGRYSTTISLPVGAYVQYKYTLGDGFWNAEHSSTGEFRLRELLVPSQDLVVQDQVDTWRAGNSAPILFEVTVPSTTPAADIISIQFNPFGWTEPLPMWPMGNNHWLYKLYGPINTLGNLHYRYCREGQCGSADDLSTAGDDAQGRTVETSLADQDIQDIVSDWAWLENSEPSTLVGSTIADRGVAFVAGVEFGPGYQPNWSYYDSQAIQNIQGLGANWLVYTPSWTYGTPSPLEFGLVPEHDPFWLDSAVVISQARAANLQVAIFPSPRFASSAAAFWQTAPRDAGWWQNWFDHYRAFAVNYADLASQTGSQSLILGGDWLDPALPGGLLADGSSSNVPSDAAARWQAIIAEVRQHFSGKVWWAMPYVPGKLQTSSGFLASTDAIYLLWSAGLAANSSASTTEMASQAALLLDNEVSPFAAAIGKPILLALAYPSADGVKAGCAADGQGGCLSWQMLSEPDSPAAPSLDLQAQSDLYEAVLNAVNSRTFIAGLISRAYYPPAMLQDKSASIHGKPAADLLWYWFPRLTGAIK